jgi:hypothetical protein
LFFFSTLFSSRRLTQECSHRPVVVFITDVNDYPLAPYHFDLSGTAFGSMAKPGLANKLRHRGIIDLEFRRSNDDDQIEILHYHVHIYVAEIT